MRITAIFLTAASFVSAMSLSADYFHPSARMVYGVNKYRRTVGDNTTYDDIITATQSATAQQAIKDDINNLTATTVALLKQFNTIAAQLLVIDNQKIAATAFSPGWAALQQQFIAHLTDSRDAASNVSAFCQEISTTIAPFVLNAIPGQSPLTPAQATSILQQVITEAQGLKSTSVLVANDFGTLITNMVKFTATFAAFAETQQKDNILIAQLNADLASLEAKIASLQTQVKAIAIAMGVTALATGGVALIFPEFAPFILLAGAVAIAGEAVAIGVLESQINTAQQAIIKDKANITTLTNQLAQIAAANATLFTVSNQTIPLMSAQLGAFQDIWTAVNSDLTQLIQFVTTAKNVPLLAYEVLKTNVSPLYTQLSTAMLAYATGLQNAGATTNVVHLPLSITDHKPLTQTAAKIQAMLKANKGATV